MISVPKHIETLIPYEPGKPIEELERELGAAWPKEGAIKLASNENPIGPSPRALEAAARVVAQVQLYPEGSAYYLRMKLAEMLAVPPAEIVVGAGSNELLDVFVHSFCDRDEEVLAPAYSFIVYKLAAQSHGVGFREIPVNDDFSYDVDRILAAVTPRTKILFLANPNNPTGVYLARPAFERLVTELPESVILVVDEAYFEYVERTDYPDAIAYRARRENLISVRTFSKIYGLAGLRIGYAVMTQQMASFAHRVRMPFNANSIGQVAARAALDDRRHLEASRALNATGLIRVTDGLTALGMRVIPSVGNFVLAHVGAGRDAAKINRSLLERGVVVRPVGIYGLKDYLRITIGTEAQNQRLLDTLRAVLA